MRNPADNLDKKLSYMAIFASFKVLVKIHIIIDGSDASRRAIVLRIPITLKVGPQQYEAGLRTTPNMPVVWISPDLRNIHGRKVSLARVLTDNGFKKNQRIFLEVNVPVVSVLPF